MTVRGPRHPDVWTARAQAISGWVDAAVVDMFLSYGPWLSFADGACHFDAQEPVGHAAHERVRAYLEGRPSERSRAALSDEVGARLADTATTLCGRFETLSDARVEARDLLLFFPAPDIARAVAEHAQTLGLQLGHPAPETLSFTAPSMANARAVGRGLDVLRLALKSHEAGERPPETTQVRQPKTRETRVRCVEADEADQMLAGIVALEASIYEPARRDPPEKLRIAFDDPAGVAVVAEAKTPDEDVWRIVGFSLGAPLELFDIGGPANDPRRGANDTLYAMSTTLDPSLQGYGLGFRLKRALGRAARALCNEDGSPRFHYVSGRNRVGMTGAMQRVNARLGAHTVCVLDNQYGGDGQARYYEMPLRAPMPLRLSQGSGAHLEELHAPFLEVPPGLAHAYESGALYAAFVAPAAGPERVSVAAIEAAESIVEDIPHLNGLHMVDSHEAASAVAIELLAQSRPGAHTVLSCIGDPSSLIDAQHHSLGDLRAVIQDLGADAIAGIAFEGVEEATGASLDESALEQLSGLRREFGIPLLALEHASAFGRCPRLSDALEPELVIWRGGERIYFVHADAMHSPTDAARTHPPDELALIRTQFWLQTATANQLDWTHLEAALGPLPTQGLAGYHVWRADAGEVNRLAERLESVGFAPRRLGAGGLAFAPPFDLPAQVYTELAKIIQDHAS